MSIFTLPSAANLPGWAIRIVSFLAIFLWAAIAFWGVIFITKGMLEFNSIFPGDRFYAIVYTFLGVIFILQVRSRIYILRKHSISSMVTHFLENKVLEVSATTIFMIAIAVIVSLKIQFIASTIFLMPLFIGTSFGFSLGQFMEQVLHIPFASFIVVTSSWLLQLFWVYMFSWIFVRVLLRFQRISPFD